MHLHRHMCHRYTNTTDTLTHTYTTGTEDEMLAIGSSRWELCPGRPGALVLRPNRPIDQGQPYLSPAPRTHRSADGRQVPRLQQDGLSQQRGQLEQRHTDAVLSWGQKRKCARG